MENMNQEPMTVKQALEATKQLLENIFVPVWLMHQVGDPVSQAAANISECINAINQSEEENRKKPEDETESEDADGTHDAIDK